MQKVYLQYWMESQQNIGVRPDGCSLHITESDVKKFINSVYEDRDPNNVPDEYERIFGNHITVNITDEVYNEIIDNGGSLRIPQHCMSNLRKMKELQPILQDEFLN